jgi:cobalt-zinc-cadmium efflux system outer membrane protein
MTVVVIAASVALALLSAPAPAQQPAPSAERFLRLEDLERMAIERNPTVGQAAAALRAAEGRQVQVGLWPNPTIGYQAEDITARDPDRGKHFVFLEQTFVTAGKLAHARRGAEHARAQAEAGRAAQRQRVLNTVRLVYYEALGAARIVEVRRELARIGREAVDVSGELFNIGQADRPDVLEAEVEAERMALDLIRAENDLERVWRVLAAAVGDPSLAPAPLAGDIEAEVPAVDGDAILVRVLADSPEVLAARADVDRARAALRRARAERFPNVVVRGGLGYNFEHDARDRDVGVEAFVEIGVPLPLFDRNQGAIAAAEAEVARVEREVERLELDLRGRLASVMRRHRDATRAVDRYRREILPRARHAYDLYLRGFRQMAASYPQVLIAQRTLGQVRADYIRALVDAWQNAVILNGLLLTGGLDAPPSPGDEPGRARAAASD